MAEDKPVGQAIAALAENFEKVAKSATAAALIFLVVFGCCYKWGEDQGLHAGQQVRLEQGKYILNELPSGEAVLFWKDDKIIQGGLYGFLTVAALSAYVVLMFIFFKPSPGGRGEWVARRLLYPNVMSAGIVLVLFIDAGLRFNLAFAAALLASGFFAVCSLRSRRLDRQIMLLVGQALLLSFFYGETRGLVSADFELHHPLVKVRDTEGALIEGLRLLKTNDSECIFVDSHGQEQMIPKAQIRAITLDPASAPETK